MNAAILHTGTVVAARDYNVDTHGNRLYCIDKSCKVPVIYVGGGDNLSPYFKTTGKNDSKHAANCGFFKPLNFVESVQKVDEYQDDLLEQGIKETVVRINFNKLDPDYEPRVIEREEKEEKKKDQDEVKVKQENETPSTIASLKSIVKLMTSYEPDVLSSIIVNVKGKKVPISTLIIDQEKAHSILWSEESIPGINYFVYGEVDAILRREKVIYINFKPVNNVLFSLILFDKYFKHFTYTDEDLKGKVILAWGHLRKNTYNDKNTTEMNIKSDKYIEILTNI